MGQKSNEIGVQVTEVPTVTKASVNVEHVSLVTAAGVRAQGVRTDLCAPALVGRLTLIHIYKRTQKYIDLLNLHPFLEWNGSLTPLFNVVPYKYC